MTCMTFQFLTRTAVDKDHQASEKTMDEDEIKTVKTIQKSLN